MGKKGSRKKRVRHGRDGTREAINNGLVVQFVILQHWGAGHEFHNRNNGAPCLNQQERWKIERCNRVVVVRCSKKGTTFYHVFL
jgi:hypothetical protein